MKKFNFGNHLFTVIYLEAPIKLPAGDPLLKIDKVCVSQNILQ